MDGRIEREKAFHDHAYSEGSRHRAAKYYAAAQAARRYYRDRLEAFGRDADVLEYGCGSRGGAVVYLGDRAASIVGIDISPVAVRSARERHAGAGFRAKLRFESMNAEMLEFPDRSFDLVCGTGVLHHLDLARACTEITRVLRPGGRAVFLEPLGHNPLINWFRRRSPELRTVDERPLRMADLAAAARQFASARHRFFALTSLATVPFRNRSWFERAARRAERLDDWVFARIPALRRHAWIVVSVYETGR